MAGNKGKRNADLPGGWPEPEREGVVGYRYGGGNPQDLGILRSPICWRHIA